MHFTRFDFLKTYQKEKKKEKKKKETLVSFGRPFNCPPSQETACPLCPGLGQLTQLRISFLQDKVPFRMLF